MCVLRPFVAFPLLFLVASNKGSRRLHYSRIMEEWKDKIFEMYYFANTYIFIDGKREMCWAKK